MDFIQYLEKLKRLEEVSEVDYESAKRDITSIVNEFVLSTESIQNKIKRKKTRKLLSVLVTNLDDLFETIDKLRVLADESPEEIQKDAQKYEARIERILDNIKSTDKSLKNLSE